MHKSASGIPLGINRGQTTRKTDKSSSSNPLGTTRGQTTWTDKSSSGNPPRTTRGQTTWTDGQVFLWQPSQDNQRTDYMDRRTCLPLATLPEQPEDRLHGQTNKSSPGNLPGQPEDRLHGQTNKSSSGNPHRVTRGQTTWTDEQVFPWQLSRGNTDYMDRWTSLPLW